MSTTENLSAPHKPIVNIAGYLFVTLDRLHDRRRELRSWCDELQLRGTILLASEGINLFLAGGRAEIDEFLVRLRRDPAVAEFKVKESLSDDQPFRRTLVRLKKEIIAFGIDQIDPRRHTSRRISPRELKSWLDQGEPITLLDVRNDYEIELGTFRDAVPIGVDHFRHFPEAAQKLPESLKKQKIVTFCTGGIRCEKAAPYLEELGFEDIYQLDGGILQYFEDCGEVHYDGDCFVFDHRVAVDPRLAETPAALCFACQAALSEADQQSPYYEPGNSCPHCYKSPDVRREELIVQRQGALEALIDPLPGSVPYDNRRPLHVPARFGGMTLLDFLCAEHPHVGRETWHELVTCGRIQWQNGPTQPTRIVTAGEQYIHVFPDTVEPDVNANIQWLHEDDWIVVINKPSPLPMHPCGRFNRNTLISLLNKVYHPLKLRVAHRLDANTSGVVVLSKTGKVASIVQPQFEDGRAKKQYLARVLGHPDRDSFASDAPIGSERIAGGGRAVDHESGQSARTEFEVLKRYSDGTSLVRARPITGRTHQIRIHLWDLGWPVQNDPLYLQNRQLGDRQSLDVDAAPMRLHAYQLTIVHPVSQSVVVFEAAAPPWAET